MIDLVNYIKEQGLTLEDDPLPEGRYRAVESVYFTDRDIFECCARFAESCATSVNFRGEFWGSRNNWFAKNSEALVTANYEEYEGRHTLTIHWRRGEIED
jgi:hypothetical protein